MKKFLRVCITLLCIMTSLVFVGCNKGKDYSVYVFVSTGGYVNINESTDKIVTKEIIYCKGDKEITLSAHADSGYQFVKWIKDSETFSTNATITVTVKDETVFKAIFQSGTSYNINYVDENNVPLGTERIAYNGIISHLPTIPEKVGYTGNFYDGTVIIKNGDAYNYGTDKIFVLKYVKNVYTVNYTESLDYTIALVSGYSSWNVEYGNQIKFTVTPVISTNTITVSAGGLQLTPESDVYTISNVTNNITLTILVNGVAPQPITKSVTFATKNLTNVDLTVETQATKNGNKYTFTSGSNFSFILALKSGISNVVLNIYANGVLLEGNSGNYTINSVKSDYTIEIAIMRKMVLDINYGLVGLVEFEETFVDSSFLPYYYVEIEADYSTLSNGIKSLTEFESGIFAVDSNGTKTKLSFIDFVDYVNGISINTEYGYRVAEIKFNHSDIDNARNWCTVNYESEDSTFVDSISFASNSFDSDYLTDGTLEIVWETYEI